MKCLRWGAGGVGLQRFVWRAGRGATLRAGTGTDQDGLPLREKPEGGGLVGAQPAALSVAVTGRGRCHVMSLGHSVPQKRTTRGPDLPISAL